MDILVPISFFLAVFGIVYLYLSTRNKERLALIEKGVDASIFMRAAQDGPPFYKIILLNLALLFIGIGLGVFLAIVLETYTTIENGAIFPAMIFTSAGASLLIGFNLTKKLEK